MEDKAKVIRKELKGAGYTSKDVSVRKRNSLYDEVIDVTIKNPNVNPLEIKKIALKQENYERDERTFEILQGGNTYIFFHEQYGLYDEVSKEFEEIATRAINSQDETTKIFDGLFLINWEHSGDLELRQQGEDYANYKVYNFNHLCELIYKFVNFGTIAV